MHYYAKFGHTDFILCLGFRGDAIRDYFLNYNTHRIQDTVLDGREGVVSPAESDIADWRITFVDTGLHSNIGQRLVRVKDYLIDEPVFLANYSDVLSNLPLDNFLDGFNSTDAIASFISVKPEYSSHGVVAGEDGYVNSLEPVQAMDFWINGGYLAMRNTVFDYIEDGEELVEEPFARLAKANKLWTQKYTGFWAPMDTFKDKITLDRMWGREDAPWLLGPKT